MQIIIMNFNQKSIRFWSSNLHFRLRLKVDFEVPKIKKRFNVKVRLEKSSTQRDQSRFEYELDETFQTSVENCRVDRGGRVNRTSRADRGRKVGRANRSRQLSRTARGKRVGKAGRVGRARGKKNKSVTIDRTKVKEAGIAKTD